MGGDRTSRGGRRDGDGGNFLAAFDGTNCWDSTRFGLRRLRQFVALARRFTALALEQTFECGQVRARFSRRKISRRVQHREFFRDCRGDVWPIVAERMARTKAQATVRMIARGRAGARVSMISSAAGRNRRSSGVRFCGVWAWRMAQAAPKARAVRTARLEAAWSRGAMDAVMVVLIAFLILSRGEQPPARYA